SKRISSIAYYGTVGNGKLLAGEVSAIPSAGVVNTWYSANPFVTCPQMACILWEKSAKPPTGGAGSGNASAQVIWSIDGGQAFCGTSSANIDTAGWPGGLLTTQSLDESAFSLSLNNGKTWNQLGLIDTDINFLSDVAASAGADTVYLSTINTNAGFSGFDSVWRSSSFPTQKNWERVFCFLATSNDTIVRIGPPEGSQPIYVAARLTGNLYASFDQGQTWSATFPGVTITDFTATKINGIPTLHALENASIRTGQGSCGSWQWAQKVNTGLTAGHTVTANTRGIVAVGESGQGRIAYSVDGGREFAQTLSVPVPGNIHPVIAGNQAIYAGSDAPLGGIYAAGNSGWVSMEPPNQSFYGLAAIGTLYGIWCNGTNSGADRTLNPQALAPPFIEWDTLTASLSSGVAFTREPVALKSSENGYLWAIDNRPYTATMGRLWAYCDCLTPVRPVPQPTMPVPTNPQMFQSPVPVAPAANEALLLNAAGDIDDIKFTWQHPTHAEEYELWVGTDPDFVQATRKYTVVVASGSMTPSVLLPSKKEGITPNTTYYWKVRVKRAENGEYGAGEWSQTMSFKIQPATPVPQPVIAVPAPVNPVNGAVNVDASPLFTWAPIDDITAYELTVAGDSVFTGIVIQETVAGTSYQYEGKLEPGATYYWQARAISPASGPASATSSFSIASESKTPAQPLPIHSNTILLILAGIAVTAIVILTIVLLKRRQTPRIKT
ncbi:MAG TPA: hypothetical protein DCX22_02505, partial [Dehalococcoidia bacterium]|nr:hypothetical protein [Dehalococcoidia bacterium]